MKRVGMFNVRVVSNGDLYGLNDCLKHEGEPMVEFYDARYEGPTFGPRGQFVSRYYISTLAEHPANIGLNLQGGVPAWSMPADQVQEAVKYAQDQA